MFDPNNLTYNSQESLSFAIELARQNHNSEINDLHLLYSLLSDSNSITYQVLLSLVEDIDLLKKEILKAIDSLPKISSSVNPNFNPKLLVILNLAEAETKKLNDSYVSREHLLLALFLTDCQSKTILSKYQLNYQKVKARIMQIRGNDNVTDKNPEAKYQVIEKYTQNLTKLAREGKLDPVIGRNQEIRRVMQVLSRRTKNNPILIGEPGVGKTAIAEGLAQRIASGDIPETLANKEVIVLDLASMLAGAKFRGEFEERLKNLLSEIRKSDEKYILFIDEIHTLMGAGAAEGAIDASNMLKPALARGELHTIGATTIKEYRNYIEKDAAFERRFQPVLVDEPTPEDTVAILRGLKEKYEVHHGIKITDDALIAATDLSIRYITDRQLPDKAIDLIDEAASQLKIDTQSMPANLDELNREITQLEIEQTALKKDKDKEKLNNIGKEIANKKEIFNSQKAKWDQQKEILKSLEAKRAQIEELKTKLDIAEREIRLDEAAKIKYGDLPEKEKELAEIQAKWDQIPDAEKIVKDAVTAEDIAHIVSSWTHIPISRLLESESQKLAHLETELHKRVIGQNESISTVANAIRRSRSGLADENRPIGSFIFLGPTGVGKTELAKALAETLFNDENALVRIDMSEYSEAHTVARLIGAPPGYIGFDEGGQLTEAIRRKPFSVILFDEIEKAHPQIFNIFLQILDDGRLTDGKGRVVNFKNTIIIMTSNLGSKLIQEYRDKIEERNQKVQELVRNYFKPEFLNRLDDIIIFDNLDQSMLTQIIDIQLKKLSDKLKNQKIQLIFTDSLKQFLAKIGYDPNYGARPMKRTIQTEILDELALEIIEGKIKPKDKIKIDEQNLKVVFEKVK